MSKKLYKLKAVPESLGTGLNPILDELERLGVDKKIAYKIHLALDELLTNIVSYAYDHDHGEVEITYEVVKEPKAIVITLSDEGKEFNPLALDEPDTSLSLEDRKIGGLGVFLAKNALDELTYHRENNKNILIAKKHI